MTFYREAKASLRKRLCDSHYNNWIDEWLLISAFDRGQVVAVGMVCNCVMDLLGGIVLYLLCLLFLRCFRVDPPLRQSSCLHGATMRLLTPLKTD